MTSYEDEAQAAAKDVGRPLNGVELDLGIFGVKQSIEMSAAGAHAASHLGFRETLLGHGFFKLPGKDPLNREVGRVFVQTFFLQEVVEG